MNEMETLRFRVDSSEVVKAGQQIKNLNDLAKESASVGKRLEMMWNGYFSTAAGLEAHLVRTLGASNGAMRRQQEIYREANAGMKQLVRNQQVVERGFKNIEKKAKNVSSVLKGTMDSASARIDPNEVILKLTSDNFKRQKISLWDQATESGKNLFTLVPKVGKGLSVVQSLPTNYQNKDQIDQYFSNFAYRIVQLQDRIDNYSSAQGKSNDKKLFKDIETYSNENHDLLKLFLAVTDKYYRPIKDIEDNQFPYNVIDPVTLKRFRKKMLKEKPDYLSKQPNIKQAWKEYIKQNHQPSVGGKEDIFFERMIHIFKYNNVLSKKFKNIGANESASKLEDANQKILSWTKEAARIGYGNITEETVDRLQRIQTVVKATKDSSVEIQDSWDQMFKGIDLSYRDPLQGFQEDVSNLSFEFKGVGDAAQDSSKDIVKANKEAQKSQDELSKAVTDGTQDALTSSLDNYTKFNYDLMDLYHDGHNSFLDYKEQETQIVDDQTAEQTRLVEQAAQEQARIQESGTVTMLKSWADMTQGWDQIAMDALQGIQETLYSSFRNAFEGVGDFWDNLWDGMKNVAYNILASIATKMANGLIANIGLNFIPGMNGGVGGNQGVGGSSGFNLPNIPSGAAEAAYNWMFHSYEAATMGAGGSQMGYGLANLGIEGAANPGTGGAGSAMGMAGGIAAAALSAYSLYDLYENGPGGAAGAVQGAMTGAMGGLALGVQIGGAAGPWGAVIGAVVGALAGGLGGGGNADVEDRIEDAKRFGKIAKELTKQANLDQDVDVDKYLEAINAGHRSDNRVDPEHMWALYNNLKSKDKLPWWAGDPGQIAHVRNRGYEQWGQPEWMRFRMFGNNLPGETGDSGMAQWFGGGGEGPWGGESNWDRVKGALDEMDNETLDRLGESLFNVKDGAAAFGVDLAELMGQFDLSQLESGEWAAILRDELTPASLMAAMNDKMRAEGMNNLEIAAQKQAAAIDSLLGTFNMSEEDTDAWVDQLFKANAEQEDLAKKMEEYQKIVEELKTLRAGEEDKAKDLIERGRELREELGLGESAFSKITEGFDKFVVAMEEIAQRLIDAARNGNIPTSHHGGYIYHRGGMVGAMLQAGLITPHGGAAYMHTGGLRPDERMAILQAGEFVIKRSSVNPRTLAALRSINATGRLPYEMYGKVMERLQDSPRFHTGGPVTPMPASAPAPQPKSGDNVTINMAPGAININPQPGQDSGEIAREVQAKFLAWIESPQGQSQLKQAVDKAPERNFV